MSSAWSQLEQLLTCAICLDRYRSPRLLPCQHSFCEFCMDGLQDYARRQIKCPECRAEHRIPYNGVQSLPMNVTLTRFLDLHRSITGEEPDPMPSQLERCSVCTEKTLCTRCAHCEKRTCEDCKEAHLEILRREIQRLVLQIRRGAGRINEVLEASDKNSDKLSVSRATMKEEISENFRRFLKDLKDKEDKMLAQVDEVLETEGRSLSRLKEDLSTELEHLQSNCDLADKYIAAEGYEWTDEELVSYKDVFIRSIDFLRNFDYDSPDNIRKLKLIYNTDVDILRKTFKEFIELKVIEPAGGSVVGGSGSSGSGSGSSDSKTNTPLQNSLMRSQSDHRLVQQFHQKMRNDATSRYGNSDGERDRSPPGLAHRSGSIRDSRLGRGSAAGDYGDDSKSRYLRASDALREWPRPSDDDYSGSGSSSKFRSRFLRDRAAAEAEEAGEEDSIGSLRSVRFEENQSSAAAQVRPRVFESDSSVRAPLSGVIKLCDSPAFAERLHQSEVRQKSKKESSSSATATANTDPNFSTLVGGDAAKDAMPKLTSAGTRQTARQVSEDEIDKQKKANQAAATVNTTASGGVNGPQVTVQSPPAVSSVPEELSSSAMTSPLSHPYVTSPRVEQILNERAASVNHSRESSEASYGSAASQVGLPITDSISATRERPASTLASTLSTERERDRSERLSSTTERPERSSNGYSRYSTGEDYSRPSVYSAYERPKLTSSYSTATSTTTPSSYRSRIARSKSSHLLGLNDESDDDEEEETTAPPVSSYRSRYSIDTTNMGTTKDPPAKSVSSTAGRSRYYYKTRDNSPPLERNTSSALDRLTSDRLSGSGTGSSDYGGGGSEGVTTAGRHSSSSTSASSYTPHRPYLSSAGSRGERDSFSSYSSSNYSSSSGSGRHASRPNYTPTSSYTAYSANSGASSASSRASAFALNGRRFSEGYQSRV